MPVTIRPSPNKRGVNADPTASSSARLLEITSKAWTISEAEARHAETNKPVGPESRRVLRTSFTDLDEGEGAGTRPAIIPFGNGFVDGILRAFQQDLHLVLRPDDVWLAILVQFSFYVNGHAEELRGSLVKHDGQETLVVDVTPTPLEEVDIGRVAQVMVELMDEHFVEDGMGEWLVPRFSTTTEEDRGVAAATMMATMKAYFEYVMMMGCGFPSVTLEGTKEDWEDLRAKLGKFGKYGEEPREWVACLEKVLDYMVMSFERPDDREIKDFWLNVAHAVGVSGSGNVATLSGWITAFCFWDDEGKRVRSYKNEDLRPMWGGEPMDRKQLVLGGVSFPVIEKGSVPKAVAEAPIKAVDLATGNLLDTSLVAGCVGMMATSITDGGQTSTRVQPRSGWWLLLNKSEPMA